jgi:hypothetical protein
MAYVSCRTAPPPELEGFPQQIICTDEAGQEWWLTEDSQVGDWLRYVEAGGEITPYAPPPPEPEPKA